MKELEAMEKEVDRKMLERLEVLIGKSRVSEVVSVIEKSVELKAKTLTNYELNSLITQSLTRQQDH